MVEQPCSECMHVNERKSVLPISVPFGFSLRKCVSILKSSMKRIRSPPWRRALVTGRSSACLCPAKGWKYPGWRAFFMWFLLGLLPEGGSSKLGMLSGRSGYELHFIEMCENTLKIVVCVCTLPGGLEDCGPHLLPISVDHAVRLGTWEGRSPCPSADTLCWGGLLRGRLGVPGFVCGQRSSQHCFVLCE